LIKNKSDTNDSILRDHKTAPGKVNITRLMWMVPLVVPNDLAREYDMIKIINILKRLYGEAGIPNGNIENKPISFVWSPKVINGVEEGKWIQVPTKYRYVIDIRLDDMLQIKTRGNDHIIH
jgi:hypothetical protein